MGALIRACALLAVAALGAGCASKIDPYVQVQKFKQQTGEFVDGSFEDTDGATADLAALRDRPLVLMLAGEFCESCLKEIGSFKAQMGSDGIPSGDARFVTLLVGADSLSAKDWKAQWEIPWAVGVQEDDATFEKWCPESVTPCLVVQLPDRGVVLREVGVVEPGKIVGLTGPWE